MSLEAHHAQHLGRFRIPGDLLERAGVRSVSDVEIRELFGINERYQGHDLAGILFPYISPVDARRTGGRVRLDRPIEDVKYLMEQGCRHLYFPPVPAGILQNAAAPVIAVESEKASLALCAFGERVGRCLLPIGLGGCYGFLRKVGKRALPDGSSEPETGPSPDLDLFPWSGRPAVLLFDSNTSTSEKVRRARTAFKKELAGRGANVLLANLPHESGINGPDDYLALHSDREMLQLLDSATSAETTPPQFSEDELALRFSSKHAGDLRYVAGWGKWLRWDGKRWRKDDTLEVFDLARAICREAAVECEIEKPKTAPKLTAAATVAAVERLARADRRHAATVDQWDADPWLLNTPNGTIELLTGNRREHRRQDYLTKSVGTGLGAESEDCVLWLGFLNRVTAGDLDVQAFLQRAVGYCLTGTIREHALFFLYGTGANGKSVFLATIGDLLGDYAKTAAISTFLATGNEQHPTDLAGLRGARLVTAIETEDGRRWAESKIKVLTGGDKIAARFMRQDFFEFAPQFKLVIAGNHKPGLRSVDEAIRRRLHLIPFKVTIPADERDPGLREELQREYPAILRWAIEGCIEWQRLGLNPPAVVLDATADYLSAEDRLGQWIEERCDVRRTNSATAGELYRSWTLWCESVGEKPGSQKRFSQNLETRGFDRDRTSHARLFKGIASKGAS
jgi:putative DNA primase/helicase